MMFTTFNTDDASSRCSTASPVGDNINYYNNSPAGSYSSLESPQSQDFTDLSTTSSGSPFVPTVTAISSSPDLQWLVQSQVSSTTAPSNRTHPYQTRPSNTRPQNRPCPPPYSRTAGMRNLGKTAKRSKAEQLSAEEEEKRRVRRERNKQAAAKCRNRRRELTDTLQAETDELEDEKSGLQNDIANLLKEKERLEFILAAHKPICKIPSDLEAAELSPSTHGLSVQLSPAALAVATSAAQAHAAAIATTSTSFFSTSPVLSSSSDIKMADLDSTLEESLDILAKVEMETARSVPDVDLSSSLYTQDWEPLYTSANTSANNTDFESLCTPVVTCTPTCTTYTSSFVFTYPEAEAFPNCGAALRRESNSNEQSSDSLSSPTLLAL